LQQLCVAQRVAKFALSVRAALADAAASRATNATPGEVALSETSKKIGAFMESLLNLVETILASARQRWWQ
jgi:hypothetical protein